MSTSNEEQITTHRLLFVEPAHAPSGLTCSWEIFNQINSNKCPETSILQNAGCTSSPSLLNLGAELESALHEKNEADDLPLIIKIRNPRTEVRQQLAPITPCQLILFSGALLCKLRPQKMFLPK